MQRVNVSFALTSHSKIFEKQFKGSDLDNQKLM